MKNRSHVSRLSPRGTAAACLGAIALCAAAPLTVALAQVAAKHMIIFVGGRTASADVRMIGGSPYVRLADIASALHDTLAKQNGNYALVPGGNTDGGDETKAAPREAAGGANQIDARRGKVGEMLMTGKYRFQVLDVSEVATYTEHFDQDPKTIEPAAAGDKLILVNCLVKNARSDRRVLNVYDTNNAVTDKDGQSYPALKYDMRWHTSFNGMCSPEMLPGASVKFAVLFSVPKDARIAEMVFTLADSSSDVDKKNDVRVTLF